ncbi:uncharacterized protein [Linepithema humile]|nr:PREDICTED: uncharacterized protein LOC105674694 isoform X2 [Linepithema humile]
MYITYYNWIYAKYKTSKIYETEAGPKHCRVYQVGGKVYLNHERSNQCLQMTKNTVWFCDDSNFLAYNRAKNGTIKKHQKIVKDNYTFIKSIAHCDDYIISGDEDGIIKRWKIKDENDFECLKIHNVDEPIKLIDATSQHIITSSENIIRIMKYDDKNGCTEEKKIFFGFDMKRPKYDPSQPYISVKSISFDPIGTKFAAGSYCPINYCQFLSSLLIYDIEKSYQVMDKKCEEYFRQLLWEDPHTILMCFDESIKKMDLRTSEFVRTWDSSKYVHSFCCSSDNMYTFMTGHFKCVLWDQRQSVAIQTYVENFDKITAIASLEFDSARMYAVTCIGLYELDFTGKDHFDHKEIKKIFGNFY